MKIEMTGEIKSRELNYKDGSGKFQIREQVAYIHKRGQPYPDRAVFAIGKDKAPWTPGDYQYADEDYVLNKYGQSEIARYPVLEPYRQRSDEKPNLKAA